MQFHFLELKSPKFVGLKFCPEKVSVKNSKNNMSRKQKTKITVERLKELGIQSSWNKKKLRSQGSEVGTPVLKI